MTGTALELKTAIEARQIKPSRHEIKQLVRNNRWDEIALHFEFEDGALETIKRSNIFNWKLLPSDLLNILFPPVPICFAPRRKKKHRPAPPATAPGNLMFPAADGVPAKKKRRARIDCRPATRARLWFEQQGLCFYCGKPFARDDLTIDHKVPLSRGGSRHAGNLVGACLRCNTSKGNLTPEEWNGVKHNSTARKQLQHRLAGSPGPA